MFLILPLNLFLTFVLNSRSWLCKSMWAMKMWCGHFQVPSPRYRAGWLDVHCISSQEEKWFFPTCDRYSRSNPAIFLESTIQQIFTLKLASPQSWRQCDEEYSTPSNQLLFTARFKEIFVKELPSTNPEPLTAMNPSKPLKIFWQHVWRRSSLAGGRRSTDPLHSSCCPFYAQLPHFVKQLVSTFLWLNHKIFNPMWCSGGGRGDIAYY